MISNYDQEQHEGKDEVYAEFEEDESFENLTLQLLGLEDIKKTDQVKEMPDPDPDHVSKDDWKESDSDQEWFIEATQSYVDREASCHPLQMTSLHPSQGLEMEDQEDVPDRRSLSTILYTEDIFTTPGGEATARAKSGSK